MLDLSGAKWRKSSRSDENGGACVEVAGAKWRKSSHSDHHGGDCVEVADITPVVAVRDSKNPAGPKVLVDRAMFTALIRAVHTGTYDLT